MSHRLRGATGEACQNWYMGGLGLELPEKAKGSKAEQTRDGHTRGLAGNVRPWLCCYLAVESSLWALVSLLVRRGAGRTHEGLRRNDSL